MQGIIFAIRVQLTYNYVGTVIIIYITLEPKIFLEPR
jgi:hypothetical protein